MKLSKPNIRTFALGCCLALAGALLLPAPVMATGTEPCIDVTKACKDAPAPGQPIEFWGTVTNCGLEPLYGVWVKDVVGDSIVPVFGPIDVLEPGQSVDFRSSYVPTESPSTDKVIARGYVTQELTTYIEDEASATCKIGGHDEICRTPGFWGTHAGTEKKDSRNITQAVIDEVGFLFVCGKIVDDTSLLSGSSALEAICVSPSGTAQLQLARQLTAAALNCVMSGAGANCADMSIGPEFAECNAICAGAPGDMGHCKDFLDCFNNGGELLENGLCKLGTCGGDGVTPCDKDETCGLDASGFPIKCVATPGNCHDRLLVNEELGLNFEPPGPAGSSNACNSAIRNRCTIFSCN